jgi:hypothetical protein
MPMAAFVFRCPVTGLNVQGWAADHGGDIDDDAVEMVKCLACQRTHLVHPKTGKILGADDV